MNLFILLAKTFIPLLYLLRWAFSIDPRFFGCSVWLAVFIAAACAHARPAEAESCPIERKATLALGRAGGFLTVPVSINGTAVTMGLDTGAQTVVTPDVAARLHLPRDWRRKTRALGTTAVFIANNAIIRDLEFSGAHYEWKSVAAVSLIDKIPFGSFTMKFDLGGLLGADILSNYDLEFDFFERTLTLYSVRGCVAMTPPWTGDFTATPFQVTPQRRIVLPVEVDGKKLTAIFDTGAYETFLSPAAAAKLGLSGKELKTEQSKTVIGV